MEGKEGEVKEEGVVVGYLKAEMRTRRKMKMRVSTTPMIKTLEIREEESKDMEKV